MKELIGNTVYRIYMNADKTQIVFETYSRFISYKAEGDCCSNSWFEHISGLPKYKYKDPNYEWKWMIEGGLGFRFRVKGIESILLEDVSTPEQKENDEHIELYGVKLITDQGIVVIEMRNASNGYYGGSISEPIIHEKLETLGEFKEILEDF